MSKPTISIAELSLLVARRNMAEQAAAVVAAGRAADEPGRARSRRHLSGGHGSPRTGGGHER